MGACFSRREKVKFKGKSKPEPVVAADHPINGTNEVEDRKVHDEGDIAVYDSKASGRDEVLSELPTTSHAKHIGNGDLQGHSDAGAASESDSDDEEFFDALSEWPDEPETDQSSSKLETSRTPSELEISRTPSELETRHTPREEGGTPSRGNSTHSQGEDHHMDKQGSSHRHSKHSHRDRPGLFSVCLSLVHRSEDADGSESTESDRHDMTSEGTSGVIHATSLPRPDAPKDPQVAGATMIQVGDEELRGHNAWCRISPSHFNVRSDTYLKNKMKQEAVGSIYDVLTCDVFVSEKKLKHVARALQFPLVLPKSEDIEIPQFLIVNTMVPLYDHSFWGSSHRTDGYNAFFVCVLNEEEYRNLPTGTRKMLIDCMKEPTKNTEGNRTEARDRMKAIPLLRNPEDIKFSAAERKLIESYNAKPVMARPQVDFYLGENYFEVDLDIHRFGIVCRRALTHFRQKMADMVLDFSFVLQGMKAEELPEKVLMSARILRVDYGGQKQWPWPGACIENDFTSKSS